MSISGYPMDPGRRDDRDEATSAEPPPDNWNAEFTAIVSGISGDMRWEVTSDELDEETSPTRSRKRTRPGDGHEPGTDSPQHTAGFATAPESIWRNAAPDTAEDRKLRRELRRQERAEALAAFQQAQAEQEAARAADTAHFTPPPPPPLPKPKRRTVGAIVLMVLGAALFVWPALLPGPFDLIVVVAALLLLGGAAMLVTGMRTHRHGPGEGWDEGAEL